MLAAPAGVHETLQQKEVDAFQVERRNVVLHVTMSPFQSFRTIYSILEVLAEH